MSKITKEQYELALARIEELLPMVDENTPLTDRNAVELSLMSDIVIENEKDHYPIEKPSVADSIPEFLPVFGDYLWFTIALSVLLT